jgi:protein-S-isoprenylcysteine O-methyltransferase Ste14
MKLLSAISNRPFLALTFLFLIFIGLNISNFINNIWFYASGSVADIIIKGQWWFAGANILVFLSLLFFLGRKNINWKTHGLFSAFIISLFVEMYGAPLAVYFLSNHFTQESSTEIVHSIVFKLEFFSISLGFDLWMTFGSIAILIGMIIIAIGWYQLWKCKNSLLTQGAYKYSRHPQYVGFLYTIWGWMIAWPTITTIVFAPLLTWAYLNAAKKEEEFMLKENSAYQAYKKRTPFLI